MLQGSWAEAAPEHCEWDLSPVAPGVEVLLELEMLKVVADCDCSNRVSDLRYVPSLFSIIFVAATRVSNTGGIFSGRCPPRSIAFG